MTTPPLLKKKKINYNVSVVISFADNLFASWFQQDGVLILSCVAALDVTEWRVGLHNPRVTQVLESH